MKLLFLFPKKSPPLRCFFSMRKAWLIPKSWARIVSWAQTPRHLLKPKGNCFFHGSKQFERNQRTKTCFFFCGGGCLILGASWHLGVTNGKIWGEKTKMDERETFILGSFKTKHAHKNRWLSTSYSCVPQIRVLHHLFGSSNLCTEVIITDRCLKPSRSEIIELGETSPVRRHQNWWHLEYNQTINRIGKTSLLS